jgi:hypothetical protein
MRSIVFERTAVIMLEKGAAEEYHFSYQPKSHTITLKKWNAWKTILGRIQLHRSWKIL